MNDSIYAKKACIRLADVMLGIQSGVLGLTNNKMMIVTQGCSHTKCPGCMSAHTWSADAGNAWLLKDLIQVAKSAHEGGNTPTGLVISGGEPLDQADAVKKFIQEFKRLFTHAEVILFTAYREKYLHNNHQDLLSLLDVAVAGPYVQKLNGYSLLGSSNQKVMLLSDYSQKAYKDWAKWDAKSQAIIKDGQFTVIGLQDTASINLSNSKQISNKEFSVFFRQSDVSVI